MHPRLTGLLILAAVPLLLFAACGGGNNNDGGRTGRIEAELTPEGTADLGILQAKDQPDEGALRDFALEGARGLITGDAARMYSLYHESFQKKCRFRDFVVAVTLIRGFYGESFQKSEPRIEDLRIEDNKGYVKINYYLDDRFVRSSIEEGDNPDEEAYLWEDGKWWAGAFDPRPKPCEITNSTSRSQGGS